MIVGCLVLAAGRSARMGGGNKLLADLGGKPVLSHVLDAIAESGLPVLVVTGNDRHAVEAITTAPTTHAHDYAEGLSRSLRAGIAAIPADWQAAIICLGDMPALSTDTLRALATKAHPAAIVVPTFDGRQGNPVLWGRDHFHRLAALEGDIGGKPLLAALAAQVACVPVESDAVLRDIDTPDALAAARANYS